MKQLKDKKAVITGGSKGIGFGIATAFAQNGADLAIIARDRDKLAAAAEALSKYEVNVDVISADLSDTNTIPDFAAEIIELCPEIDVLVNNAGLARFTAFIDVEEDELDLHIDLNVKSVYLLTRHLLPSLMPRKGNIINISSYFSHRMLPGRPSTAYSLTKGAVDAFTKALACELGPIGIRVNAIAPGTVNTPMVRSNIDLLPDEAKKKFSEMIKMIYPLGRIGEPEDLGGIAVYLASDQARWVTGSIISVDGGLTTN